ncbi:hypothetical protein Tco_0946474 [Tanacetum coccineum]
MGSKKEGVFRGGPKGYSVSIPKTVKKQESKSSCCFRSLSESRRFWKSRIRKKDIVNLIYFRGLCLESASRDPFLHALNPYYSRIPIATPIPSQRKYTYTSTCTLGGPRRKVARNWKRIVPDRARARVGHTLLSNIQLCGFWQCNVCWTAQCRSNRIIFPFHGKAKMLPVSGAYGLSTALRELCPWEGNNRLEIRAANSPDTSATLDKRHDCPDSSWEAASGKN